MDLFTREWFVENAKATIVLVHGTGEHSGRYEHVAAYLNQHGYNVQSGDLPGWGQSPGTRGHVHSFQEYTSAVEKWVNIVTSKLPADHTIFIMGHSLGGLVATRFVQGYSNQDRLAGLILSSPCLQLKIEVPAWKVSLAGMLNQFIPTLRMANGISPNDVTRDPVMRQLYVSDPLNYDKVSVRWFNELHQAMNDAWRDKGKINIPLLVFQAADDRLISPEAVERFVKETPTSEKLFHSFPNLYHEIFNEPERDDVLFQLVAWIEHKLA